LSRIGLYFCLWQAAVVVLILKITKIIPALKSKIWFYINTNQEH